MSEYFNLSKGTVETEIYDSQKNKFKKVIMTIDEYKQYYNQYSDYRGNTFGPPSLYQYSKCANCGKYVHLSMQISNHCPLCIIQSLDFELEIIFGYSKSSKYKKACKIAQSIFPYYLYSESEFNHIIRFMDAYEYVSYISVVDKLLLIISNWRSFHMTLNRNPIKYTLLSNIQHDMK